MRILSLDLSTKFLYQPGVNNLQQFQGLHVVYLIVFPNNKMYCGYSSNISQRWNHGISAYKSCNLVYRAFQKYGWDNEDIKKYIIFSSGNKQQALNKEKETIEKLDLLNHEKGYNLVEGGNASPSWTGKHHTEETKELLSKKIEEKWQDPIFAEKVRQKMLGRSFGSSIGNNLAGMGNQGFRQLNGFIPQPLGGFPQACTGSRLGRHKPPLNPAWPARPLR